MRKPRAFGLALDPADFRRGFGVWSLLFRVLYWLHGVLTSWIFSICHRMETKRLVRSNPVRTLADMIEEAHAEQRRADLRVEAPPPAPYGALEDGIRGTLAIAERNRDRSLRYVQPRIELLYQEPEEDDENGR